MKGIETFINPTVSVSANEMSLDTLSRLKGIETNMEDVFFEGAEHPLDTLSRLKGIETWINRFWWGR